MVAVTGPVTLAELYDICMREIEPALLPEHAAETTKHFTSVSKEEQEELLYHYARCMRRCFAKMRMLKSMLVAIADDIQETSLQLLRTSSDLHDASMLDALTKQIHEL